MTSTVTTIVQLSPTVRAAFVRLLGEPDTGPVTDEDIGFIAGDGVWTNNRVLTWLEEEELIVDIDDPSWDADWSASWKADREALIAALAAEGASI